MKVEGDENGKVEGSKVCRTVLYRSTAQCLLTV